MFKSEKIGGVPGKVSCELDLNVYKSYIFGGGCLVSVSGNYYLDTLFEMSWFPSKVSEIYFSVASE